MIYNEGAPAGSFWCDCKQLHKQMLVQVLETGVAGYNELRGI